MSEDQSPYDHGDGPLPSDFYDPIGSPTYDRADFMAICKENAKLRTQVEKLREAIKPLIELAAEYQIHHDGIMWAWIDKASPDAVEALNSLRGKLFEAGKAARAAYEETGAALSGENTSKFVDQQGHIGDSQ